MSLAYTQVDKATEAATLYVFTPTQGTGFLIVAADDAVTPVIGYSDTDVFEAEDIPSNVQWWLDRASAQIAAAAAAGSTDYRPLMSTDRAAIAPLCQTTWNQGAPYYNKCPKSGTRYCYTGCVATAMAQVMKVHEWPLTGTGSHSYTWNNKTLSFDYANTTFDWTNMLNGYPTSTTGTSAQREAIATLMYACGVAADMSYGTSGSGAYGSTAAAGMINYLKYDAGMSLEMRDWYTDAEWEELVYSELEAGRPLYYDGNDGSAGHAFVCDGYSNNSYFHFNWGWEGSYNGYFLLSNLYPEGQGIGGGSGEAGYNYDNAIMYHCRPAVEGQTGAKVYALSTGGYLAPTSTRTSTTAKWSFSKSTSSTIIYFRGLGDDATFNAYYNTGIWDIPSPTLGVILEDVTGNRTTVTYGTQSTVANTSDGYYHGFYAMMIYADDLPLGEYNLWPAFKPDGGEWTKCKANASLGQTFLHCVVTSSTVTFSQTDFEPITAEYVGSDVTEDGYRAGEKYNFTFSITAPSGYTGEMQVALVDSTGVTQATGTLSMALTAGTSRAIFPLTFPETLEPGNYTVELQNTDGTNTYASTAIVVKKDETPARLSAYISSISPDTDTLMAGNTVTATSMISTTKDVTATVAVCMISGTAGEPDTYEICAKGDAQTIDILAAGAFRAPLRVTAPDSLPNGQYYLSVYTVEDTVYTMIGDNTYPILYDNGIHPEAAVKNVIVDGNTGDAITTIDAQEGRIEVEIECISGEWADSVYCSFIPADSTYSIVNTSSQYITLRTGEAKTLTFSGQFDNLWSDITYQMSVMGDEYGLLTGPYSIAVTNGLVGIEGINADTEAPEEYYNLQGIRVTNPTSGVYILRRGSSAIKVRIK